MTFQVTNFNIETLLAIQSMINSSVIAWIDCNGFLVWAIASEVSDEYLSCARWLINQEGIVEV